LAIFIQKFFTLSFVVFACFFSLPAEAKDHVGRARIVDGDTIVINGVRIRFYGLDTPEKKQLCKRANGKPYRCGSAATAYLRGLIGKQRVVCRDLGPAIIGQRRWGKCTVNGKDIFKAMVRAGHARIFHTSEYAVEEKQACAAKIGLWQGFHKTPGQFRRCFRRDRSQYRACSF
jgi:endonuclease YncB( thermonuclease family)